MTSPIKPPFSSLRMGTVELGVHHLKKQTEFYSDLVGLEQISSSQDMVELGHNGTILMRLVHDPQSSRGRGNEAGLYHTAILFSSRATLSEVLYRILTRDPSRYVGSADHLVSEAFYFTDYEGNGVELYVDRESSSWEWRDGSIVMASLPLDPTQYITTHGVSSGTVDRKKSVGHVHLQVGDIAHAKKFYADILGFVVTAELPGALFISDGNYHHHIGMNTWMSQGAGKRTALRGLRKVTLHIPFDDMVLLEDRLLRSHIPYTKNEHEILFEDPWGIVFHVIPNS